MADTRIKKLSNERVPGPERRRVASMRIFRPRAATLFRAGDFEEEIAKY